MNAAVRFGCLAWSGRDRCVDPPAPNDPIGKLPSGELTPKRPLDFGPTRI
jgi:hypothetical protein